MLAKVESVPALPGTSPVCGKRIIARVEASAQGTDRRFVVTNLAGGRARTLYEDLYRRRG
jgi:hypothetical protein